MRTRQRIQNFLGCAATSSFDLVVTRGASRFRADKTCNGVGDLVNGDRKHRRRIGRAAAIGRFALSGIANDDTVDFVWARVWAVARGIGGAIEADDWRAKRGGKVQRAGVRRDDEFCAAQQRHQWTEAERNGNGRPRSCRADEFLRQSFFSWTKTDYSSPAVLRGEAVMQFTVAFRWPTFRAPAAARI